jgi:hypothetical protein
VLGAACAAGRYRDVASHSSFESAGREWNSPALVVEMNRCYSATSSEKESGDESLALQIR